MQLTPTQEVPETLDVFQFSGFQHEVNIFAFWCSVLFYCTFTFKSPNQKKIYRNIESGMIVQKKDDKHNIA